MNTTEDSGSGVARRRRVEAISLLLLILSLLMIFFYPKQRVVGGLRGGPIAPGERAYREDYTCIGVKYDFCPEWPDYGCDYLCFGLVTGETCTLEQYEVGKGLERYFTACKEAVRPRWGFPSQ